MIECRKLIKNAFVDGIDLNEEYLLALSSVDGRDRLPSNLLRNRLCNQIFHSRDVATLENIGDGNYRIALPIGPAIYIQTKSASLSDIRKIN